MSLAYVISIQHPGIGTLPTIALWESPPIDITGRNLEAHYSVSQLSKSPWHPCCGPTPARVDTSHCFTFLLIPSSF
ncbi:hypothetical protein ACN38_g9440 [Penicillium nordicum]|uniref:Uncharacterized protein n=1 Tax=Penicillium nordicum TaxID=229535 RepID=A0A0M8P348_9EURO|nr:hypothetical protein ACN38_g9440 [Penicillium nordicum]